MTANIVRVAVRIIAGPENGQVDRAAKIVGVSSATLYRWLRGGNMQGARGADLLRVHDLTGVPLELLLGADALPAGPGKDWRAEGHRDEKRKRTTIRLRSSAMGCFKTMAVIEVEMRGGEVPDD